MLWSTNFKYQFCRCCWQHRIPLEVEILYIVLISRSGDLVGGTTCFRLLELQKGVEVTL